jgi:putative transposase
VKYELVYPGDFDSGAALRSALDRYFHFYNHERPHQGLANRMPAAVYLPQPASRAVRP